jgi:hypothetical protein
LKNRIDHRILVITKGERPPKTAVVLHIPKIK